MFKNVPLLVKIVFWVLIAQLVAWPLMEYLSLTYNPPFTYDYAFADIALEVTTIVFVVGTLPSVLLVGWELLKAFKTKKHIWTLYILLGIIVLLWAITLTYHPTVHHCGCTA